MGQHYNNIGHKVDTTYRTNVTLMSAHRLRRWDNIIATFVAWCVVNVDPTQSKHFYNINANVFDVGPTLYKCYTNVLCLLGSILNHPSLDELFYLQGTLSLPALWLRVWISQISQERCIERPWISYGPLGAEDPLIERDVGHCADKPTQAYYTLRNTSHWPCAGLMLGQCCRRWTNSKPAQY